MQLLTFGADGEPRLTTFIENLPPYAILSHTWGTDEDEVTFNDLKTGSGKSKPGYDKIEFCGQQASKDGLQYFWVDTCCIDRANLTELSEAITSMFQWYRNAVKCYVYLPDVSICTDDDSETRRRWKPAFRKSRWFTRGWTLQELIAPKSVEFFSRERERLGDKHTLEQQIHEITDIPVAALRGASLSDFSVDERFQWAGKRETKRIEDQAYCLLGIFDISMSLRYGEGTKAFDRLKEKAGKSFRSAGPITNPKHWNITRSINPLFTGRDEILSELGTIICDAVRHPSNQNPCWIVISGMGGQGKSEICLQLALRVRQSFWGVFWVDVSTPSLAENGFLTIASQLDIPAESQEDVRRGLANMKKPWLLVLDNADDVNTDYQQYFPTAHAGVVLLTSRNAECQQYATLKWIKLEGLLDSEARELLFRTACIPNTQQPKLEDDAQVVASLLRSHPLALIQAGSYISHGHCTLKQYPDVYQRQRKRLLTFRPTQARSRYGDVYATFEASAEILQSSNTEPAHHALQFLMVMASLGPTQLPLLLFEAAWTGAQFIPWQDEDINETRLMPWHVSHLPPVILSNNNGWDSFRLVEAIHLLRGLSLVTTDNYDGSSLSVSMHPLIHVWANDRLSTSKQHESWVTAGCLVAVSLKVTNLWRDHQWQLQPHLHALVSWEISRMFTREYPTMIIRILMKCGWQLYRMRSDAKVSGLMDRLLTHIGLDQMRVDPKWLEIYELTAWNLHNHGRVKEAVPLLEQMAKIREQTLAEDHPSRLTSQQMLAGAYRANGQVQKAVALLEQVVRIREQTLAENHLDRLTSLHELAGAYHTNGQVKEAVALLEQVVKIREQTLAENHFDRLTSQHELARVYHTNGQVKEAVALLEQVVKIREQTLAEEHPDLLDSQHELAGAYHTNGQVKEAVALLGQVVKIREQTLAEEHPDRLTSLHELARAYHTNGQVKEAVALLEQVVKIEEQTLAENHFDRLTSQLELARAYHTNEQVKEAVALLEQVVKIREQTLAEEHPDLLDSQHELAGAYHTNGQVKEAVALLGQVVKIREQTLAENHFDRLTSLHELARAYHTNGQVKEAVALLEQVVKIREQTLAEDHFDRLSSQHNLSTYYWDLGQHIPATKMMGRVVEIQQQALDKHHPHRRSSESWFDRFLSGI